MACKVTGGLEIILMDGTKTKNILLALQEMEACYSPIKQITCDAGTNLLNLNVSNLNHGEKKLLSKLEIVNHMLPNSQQRNYVERRIQTFKRYVRASFAVPRRNSLPILSLQEIRTVFKKIVRHINEIPFSPSPENSIVSPGTFIYPSACLSEMGCGDEITVLHGFSASAVKMQKHLDVFMHIRNQLFVDAKRFLHKPLKIKGQRKGDTGATLSVNDIVMINPRGKYNQGRFGIVTKISSDQTVEVLTRERGPEAVAIVNLHPLVPQHTNVKRDPGPRAHND